MAEELKDDPIQNNFKGSMVLIMGEPHFDTETLAENLGLKKGTLQVWRVQKRGPAYKKIGLNVFYPIAEVKRWINDQCSYAGVETKEAG